MAVFVDTNVLVYARDLSEGHKQVTANDWLIWLWRSGSARLSFQVLQEYYVTTTERLRPGLTKQEARDDVRQLMAWQPVPVDDDVIEGAWTLMDTHQVSFWDALIVAAALRAGCDRLLTEDLPDGQVIGGVLVVNPFTNAPG